MSDDFEMNEHEQLAYEAGCTIGSVGLKAEITRLRTHVDGIVPKWAAARDEVDRLRAALAESHQTMVTTFNQKNDELCALRAALAEAERERDEARNERNIEIREKDRVTKFAERAEAESLEANLKLDEFQRRIWKAEADLGVAREVMTKVTGLIDSESDDPLQDAIDMAIAFLERTTAAPAAPLSPTPPK